MSIPAQITAKDFASAAGVESDLRKLLDGLVTADWRQALIARGFGWNVTVGSLSTGVTGGGAGTVLDLDQPEFGISVPSGYTLIPHEFHIQVRPGLQTTDAHVTEILVAADRTAAYAGDGTVVAETPLNLRTSGTGAASTRGWPAGSRTTRASSRRRT